MHLNRLSRCDIHVGAVKKLRCCIPNTYSAKLSHPVDSLFKISLHVIATFEVVRLHWRHFMTAWFAIWGSSMVELNLMLRRLHEDLLGKDQAEFQKLF